MNAESPHAPAPSTRITVPANDKKNVFDQIRLCLTGSSSYSLLSTHKTKIKKEGEGLTRRLMTASVLVDRWTVSVD